jgi:hypothetical protein
MPPLRGLNIYSLLIPMTRVMGYKYLAPTGLETQPTLISNSHT